MSLLLLMMFSAISAEVNMAVPPGQAPVINSTSKTEFSPTENNINSTKRSGPAFMRIVLQARSSTGSGVLSFSNGSTCDHIAIGRRHRHSFKKVRDAYLPTNMCIK